MIARLFRLLPPRVWAAQVIYAAVVLLATYFLIPRFLPIAAFVLPVTILAAILGRSRPPARHRRKHSGSQHLAE